MLYAGGQSQYYEKSANRGFFSGSEQIIHFGLGQNAKVDKIEITYQAFSAEGGLLDALLGLF